MAAAKQAVEKAIESAAGFVKSRKYRDVVVLVLTADGRIVGPRPSLDENDQIHVFVIGPIVKASATCSLAPSFRTRGDVAVVAEALAKFFPTSDKPKAPDEKHYEWIELRSCDGDAGIGISISRKAENPTQERPLETKELNLAVAKLYRLSVGAGLVFDFSRPASFGVGVPAGESITRITNQTGRTGVDGIISFQVHPRRVNAVGARVKFFEIFSPMVGASLRQPLHHIYLGGALEPWPGIGLTGGYHFQKEDRLDRGYRVGDPITGNAPTSRAWMAPTGREWFLGLVISSDLIRSIMDAKKNAKTEASNE